MEYEIMLGMNLYPPIPISDILKEGEVEYDWLIPGLFERGDRMILTGNEGKGKSTFLRQLAVQISQGIHPFTLEPIERRRVLLMDLENPPHLVARKLSELNPEPVDEWLYVARWPQGLDLSHVDYRNTLSEYLGILRPDFVIGGPMYKMSPQLEKEAESANLASFIDNLRAALKFSIIMESHQPHQVIGAGPQGVTRFRPERPFGSSLWLRWPEFGFCLEDDGVLRPWRGLRDEREFPEKLRWGIPSAGEVWPWVLDARVCLVCHEPLDGKKERFCSTKCGTAYRMRTMRSKGAVQGGLM